MKQDGKVTYKIRFFRVTKSNKRLLQVFIKRSGELTNTQKDALGVYDMFGLFYKKYENILVLNKWLDNDDACMVSAYDIINYIKNSGLDYSEVTTSGFNEFIKLKDAVNDNYDWFDYKLKLFNVPNFFNKLKYAVEHCK